ncbi:PREDICTED: uncharacterized protein LOC109193036 [Ipomoea nil]|uniref:uncharacterized protein LOC109193036 n=1 Tax=Ipomoea nil TaxID=35883 RepID=UPI000901677D|nr:PREDICTED: uncharacterized protein LOC109193036 [Ipomoea nil]
MTTDTDEPLDFEFEEPAVYNKKKKVIGLDDLLNDFYKEDKKVTKRSKVQKAFDSDDDIDEREATFHICVNEFQEKMNQIKADDEMSLWGLQVFGCQKTLPKLDFPELTRCRFLQSFLKHDLNSLVELKTDEGHQSFLEGLLVHGWLLKLISSHGRLERSIAKWSFNMLLYSPQQQLGAAACSFWCHILSSKSEIDLHNFEIEWLPGYSELISALDVYGFLLDAPSKASSSMELDHLDSDSSGPPQNIRSWIKFVSVICQVRNTCSVFSTEEVEDLIVVIICMFMDRQLLGLSLILDECLHSLISFFSDSEFDVSCVKIAKSLTCRLATDISCLRAVDSISVLDARSKCLKSAVAYEFLVACFDSKVFDAEGILKSIISINLRDETFDLQKMYIYLILVENWVFCDPMLKDNPEVIEKWGVCLRNCTCQISSTDLRSYALKVRSKASYLSQGNARKA